MCTHIMVEESLNLGGEVWALAELQELEGDEVVVFVLHLHDLSNMMNKVD